MHSVECELLSLLVDFDQFGSNKNKMKFVHAFAILIALPAIALASPFSRCEFFVITPKSISWLFLIDFPSEKQVTMKPSLRRSICPTATALCALFDATLPSQWPSDSGPCFRPKVFEAQLTFGSPAGGLNCPAVQSRMCAIIWSLADAQCLPTQMAPIVSQPEFHHSRRREPGPSFECEQSTKGVAPSPVSVFKFLLRHKYFHGINQLEVTPHPHFFLSVTLLLTSSLWLLKRKNK